MRLSFEFFPPQTARGRANLVRTAQRLARFAPHFYSVTYGAGGTTRERTFAAVTSLLDASLSVAPHLSWGSDDESRVLELIDAYRSQGVNRLVALRGDLPSGIGRSRFRHAEDLVRLVRHRFGPSLTLEVAAYPEVHPDAPSADADIHYLKRKVEAGANGCITQYFYNADSYFYLRDRCTAAGMSAPIVPGVMPITNYLNLAKFSRKAGTEIPRWMEKRMQEIQHDEAALTSFGADVVTALCERLLKGGAPGLHFYTLNKDAPTATIVERLRAATAG